jgi:hypothetical protein
VPNIWKQFADLLPNSPRLIGTLVLDHGDGTATITLLDGGVLRVKGRATAGQRVFVRDGRIEGEAPDLSQIQIEI